MLRSRLGVETVLWLGMGLIEDRDTDGHVDLIAAFIRPGEVLLQTVPEDNPNFDHCEENLTVLVSAGVEVTEMPYLPYAKVAGEPVAASYLNFYICNGGVIVPVAGAETDAAALADHRRGLSRPRDRAGAGARARLRRRRSSLHHPAGTVGRWPTLS